MNKQERAERRVWDLVYCSHQGEGQGLPRPRPTVMSTIEVAPKSTRAGGRLTQVLSAAPGKLFNADTSQGKHPSPHLASRPHRRPEGWSPQLEILSCFLARTLLKGQQHTPTVQALPHPPGSERVQ